jgi:hypothetical protein
VPSDTASRSRSTVTTRRKRWHPAPASRSGNVVTTRR